MPHTIPGIPVIPAKDLHFRFSSRIYNILAAISCYICIFPLVLVDFFLWQFQNIYFKVYEIPLIDRKKYVVLDRYNLKKLTLWQKINCLYCEYANGVVGFSKAVVNQMELYSCAIKHVHQPLGQEHHRDFFERKDFE
jgi:hypothetical protein